MADDFSSADLARIEASTRHLGRQLFDRLSGHRPGVFRRRYWDDRLMNWALADEAVKVQLFRFVDVLPTLSSGESITRHLHEYLNEVWQRVPRALRVGLSLAPPRSLGGKLLAVLARRNALAGARRFIAGASPAAVLHAAQGERQRRRAFTLDLLGEAVISDAEADLYLQTYLNLLEGTAPTINGWPEVPQIDRGAGRELPRVNVSVKLSALDARFDPIDPEGSYDRAGSRLRELFRAARRQRGYVHVDMESYHTKNLTLAIFQLILLEEEFRDWTDVGIVIQAYLRDAPADLHSLAEWARRRGAPVWVRLVKGAYWDYETVHAQAEGWPIPVFQQKWQSDACFEQLARFLFLNRDCLHIALASHNLRSLAHGIAVADYLHAPPDSFELQMLYGMADPEKQVLVEQGFRLRVYMPFGELLPGMAYLVRRLLENTSNDSFLKASVSGQVPPDVLLAQPAPPTAVAADGTPPPKAMPHGSHSTPNLPSPEVAMVADQETIDQMLAVNQWPEFTNEPLIDFALDQARTAMQEALALVAGRLGRVCPLAVAGRALETTEIMPSLDPSCVRRVVGQVSVATPLHVNQAVAAASAALPAWNALGARRRGEIILRAAEILRERRFELAAWIIYECGKGWREADADVCEAIDFCEYYAREALRLEVGGGRDVPGEENRFGYIPRGVTAVISPWNFPLAIPLGMTVAALATGNPVILKPAEQAAVTGARLYEVLDEAGVPPGVLSYLPGLGEVVGAALVEHPQVALIAFTGSRAVGLAINAKAAEVSTRAAGMVKRVIAEMGGKNAIIIDDDADLDEAVVAVLKSAFGYQGQKCSACSRVIVLAGVHDVVVQRLVEAARSLQVGPANDPANAVGPVIDAEALARIESYLELGRREGQEVLAVDVGDLRKEGYFVGPHIFANVSPSARLAQEEVFGPVLAVIRVANLDEALTVANGTPYALTGGIFSRSPAHLERACREFMVGNLYLNRGITGALVARQPFGGFKMSGIGSKAGGPDYLLQFVLPRTITENTMRRGFAPAAVEEGF